MFLNDEYSEFLEKLRSKMGRLFELVKKRMREKNAHTIKALYSKFDMNLKRVHQEISDFQRLQEIRNEVENVDEMTQMCRYYFCFLKLLCEGNYYDMQTFLRDQSKANHVSKKPHINFIMLAAEQWGSFIKFVNSDCCELGMSMLDFMNESVQGNCLENQMELFRCKIVENSNDFLIHFKGPKDYESCGFTQNNRQDLDDLLITNISLLNNLLEANPNPQIQSSLGNIIQFPILISKLSEWFVDYFRDVDWKNPRNLNVSVINSLDLYRHDLTEEVQKVITIFFFIQIVNESTMAYQDKIKELSGVDLIAYRFFESYSGHIEILFKDKLQKVYFMVHPFCHNLNGSQKQTFLQRLKKSYWNQKITDFIAESSSMFDLIDYMSILRRRCKLISQGTLNFIRDACLVLVSLINIYVFAFFEKEVRENIGYTKEDSRSEIIIRVAGSVHVFLSLLMLILLVILEAKIIFLNGWKDKFAPYRKKIKKYLTTEESENSSKILTVFYKNMIDLTFGEKVEMLKLINNINGYKHQMPYLEYIVQSMLFVVGHKKIQYFVLYLTLSVFALAGNLVLIYSIHLLDIIVSFSCV